MVDGEWDVILIGAGQNNFALGTYLGMAGLRTVICESRLENGGRLASEEITLPGYWHNTLAYYQDNREVSPVWKELDWENGHHAEFVSPPVVSSLLLADGQSISHHQALNGTVQSVSKLSPKDAETWRALHDRFHNLIREYLIPHYYCSPRDGAAILHKLDAEPEGKEFRRLWQLTPRQIVDEFFEHDAVKTLLFSQMAIPRGVALDYAGGGVEVLKMIAGEEKPELARGGSHSIAQVLQRAYVHHGGQIRAVHHVEKILINDDGRAVGVRLRDGREWTARLAVVSNTDPYSTLVEMVGEDYLPRTFYEQVKGIQFDEFSYFQVHVALKAPVRYALYEATDPAVGQAINVNMGPQRPVVSRRCGKKFAPANFPSMPACMPFVRPLSIPCRRPAASMRRQCTCPCRFS